LYYNALCTKEGVWRVSYYFCSTLALKHNGSLWAWGYNIHGQLGDETIVDKDVPTRVVSDADDWEAVSAGLFHTLALKSDGTLWAWGRNEYGQLGDGTTNDSDVPIEVGTD
jgi:alpha-tubulin suppressor-like RCC1 family protein